MASVWTYDRLKHQFRNTATGKVLTYDQMIATRDTFLEARQLMARSLAARYMAGEIGINEWTRLQIRLMDGTFSALYALGAGGYDRVEELSRAGQTLQRLIGDQIPFMDNFIQEVRAGNVSADEMANRAALYQGAAVESYEAANSDDWEIDLPYYPGSATCLGNCRCYWDIETVFEDDDEVTYATWVDTGDSAECDECMQRAADWPRTEIKRAKRTDQSNQTDTGLGNPDATGDVDELFRRVA